VALTVLLLAIAGGRLLQIGPPATNSEKKTHWAKIIPLKTTTSVNAIVVSSVFNSVGGDFTESAFKKFESAHQGSSAFGVAQDSGSGSGTATIAMMSGLSGEKAEVLGSFRRAPFWRASVESAVFPSSTSET
jgi:hypothetical protein